MFPGGAPISPIAITCTAFILLHASGLAHVSKEAPRSHHTSLVSTAPPMSRQPLMHTSQAVSPYRPQLVPDFLLDVCDLQEMGVCAPLWSVCETSYDDCTLSQSWGRHSYPPAGSKAMMI